MSRIVLVVSTFPKRSETFIIGKFLGLLAKGWDCHIVCNQSDAEEWLESPELRSRPELRRRVHMNWPHRPRWLAALLAPVAVVRCFFRSPSATWRYLTNKGQLLNFDTFRQIYFDAEIICLQPDLIHFEFGALAVNRMHVQELMNCKVVVSFRGFDLGYSGLEQPDFYREVWDKANALHFLSAALWSQAQQRGCPSNKRHAVISPAINAEFYDPLERRHIENVGGPERPLRILSVGRVEWVKGYEYALQAIELLVKQQVHCEYRIIGDGEYLEAVRFARHRLQLNGTVHFLGALSSPEIKAHLLWADVFLHTAVSEGFSNAVLEAQAMALPVVCTDAGGLPENVADGRTGFVVRRRQPEPLAEKLLILALQPALRAQMGSDGRKRVLTSFQLDKQAADFDQLFREVLPGERQAKSSGFEANPHQSDKGPLTLTDLPKKNSENSTQVGELKDADSNSITLLRAHLE